MYPNKGIYVTSHIIVYFILIAISQDNILCKPMISSHEYFSTALIIIVLRVSTFFHTFIEIVYNSIHKALWITYSLFNSVIPTKYSKIRQKIYVLIHSNIYIC